jgi:hypothetical protein
MTQVLRRLEFILISIIMLIGIVALTAELTQNEEIAKIVVISGYCLLKIAHLYPYAPNRLFSRIMNT